MTKKSSRGRSHCLMEQKRCYASRNQTWFIIGLNVLLITGRPIISHKTQILSKAPVYSNNYATEHFITVKFILKLAPRIPWVLTYQVHQYLIII